MPDIANMSDSKDSNFAHLLKTKSRPDWLKPIPDDERPATPEPIWVIPTSHIPDAALSISKMKAARYHEFGLELLVPEHMWINDVCTYDISASYVRTYMRILSVVSIKAYSRYKYDYLKEITLCRVDHQEYTIAEKDFKNLYPNEFEDLNLLLFQGHLNHLPGSDIRMLSTLNLTKPGWDAKGFEYKHDYTIIDSPCAVVFPVSNNERKIMRFNEIYKFSDGTLTNIMEALDYKVKENKVNMLNPVDIGKVAVRSSLRSLKSKRTIETRAKRSSINLIRTLSHITCSPHNVKTMVIIRVLCIILVVLPEYPSDTYVFIMKMEILLEPTSNKLMVGDSDVHTLEDPTLILEILSRRFFLRLNLPDHRSVLTGSGGSSKDGDGDTSIKVKGTSRTTNNQAFTIKKGMSMPVQMSQAQDGERPQVDDQRLDLADDLKEAQDHISRSITSHKTKTTTSMYKISHEESKTTS
ncbi:hypothetical protein Tco_0270859 [Tanacetum coccineum]